MVTSIAPVKLPPDSDCFVVAGAARLPDFSNLIEVPELTVPDISDKDDNKLFDLFATKKRKAWNENHIEPRCDFSPGKNRIVSRTGLFRTICQWRRSLYGPTLSEIKNDESFVPKFAEAVSLLIQSVIGSSLKDAGWAIITPPARRHKDRNFAQAVAAIIARDLSVPFYHNLALAKSKQRVNAVYSLNSDPPPERNLILFDDIITTGSTLTSMYRLLTPLGFNIISFAAIDNRI